MRATRLMGPSDVSRLVRAHGPCGGNRSKPADKAQRSCSDGVSKRPVALVGTPCPVHQSGNCSRRSDASRQMEVASIELTSCRRIFDDLSNLLLASYVVRPTFGARRSGSFAGTLAVGPAAPGIRCVGLSCAIGGGRGLCSSYPSGTGSTTRCDLTTRSSGPWAIVGRVWPRQSGVGRPLN
jgi:hypothetical protein